MKRLILLPAVALLTFSLGLAIDRISPYARRADRPNQTRQLEPLNRDVTVATLPPPPTPLSTTPTADHRSHLIFDYDTKKFVPDGAYAISRSLKGFEEFSFYLESWQENADGQKTGNVMVNGYANERYYSQSAVFALVTEQRLVFVTQGTSDDEFDYRFDGEFLRGNVLSDAPEGTVVLKGKLTKSQKGRKIAERVVSFRVEFHGC